MQWQNAAKQIWCKCSTLSTTNEHDIWVHITKKKRGKNKTKDWYEILVKSQRVYHSQWIINNFYEMPWQIIDLLEYSVWDVNWFFEQFSLCPTSADLFPSRCQ